MQQMFLKVPPHINNIVIFRTDCESNHGFPDPLKCPKTISRKSIATYYFSKGRPLKEILKVRKKNTTNFKNRYGDKNDVFIKKEYLKNFFRKFNFYHDLKNLEKKYLRTGNSKIKRKN